MKNAEFKQVLESFDFIVAAHDNERTIISHDSYPNFEAHLFTIADAAGWRPRLLSSGDVELQNPFCTLNSEDSQVRFLEIVVEIEKSLNDCGSRISNGDFPSFVWAHHEFRWHRFVWDALKLGPLPSAEYLDYVDPLIRPYILRLNELGFTTKESCSGLLEEHPDREPYWPYVMFDERAYPGISPHLFTLADMALWDTNYAPHYFDIYLKVQKKENTLASFGKLVSSAEILQGVLEDHLKSNAHTSLTPNEWRYQSYSIER